MKLQIITFVSLLLLLSIFQCDGEAINCYVCNSTGCADPFNSNNQKTTLSTNGWCWKGKGQLKGQKGVWRDVATNPIFQLMGIDPCSANKCTDIKNSNGQGISCCCDKNLCNFGIRSNVDLSTMLLPSIFAMAMFIFNH